MTIEAQWIKEWIIPQLSLFVDVGVPVSVVL